MRHLPPKPHLCQLPTVTAAEMRQNFATLISSVKDQPIALYYHRRCVGVLLSAEEYQQLVDKTKA